MGLPRETSRPHKAYLELCIQNLAEEKAPVAGDRHSDHVLTMLAKVIEYVKTLSSLVCRTFRLVKIPLT